MTPAAAAAREPGAVTVGDWAHVRYARRQHRVVADEPTVDDVQPIRFACGKRAERFRIWHDPALPHLPRCVGCEAVNDDERGERDS